MSPAVTQASQTFRVMSVGVETGNSINIMLPGLCLGLTNANHYIDIHTHTMYNELSRRTATSRYQIQPRRLPERDGAKVLLTSDQVGLYLASTHQMAPPCTHPEIRLTTHLSTPEG